VTVELLPESSPLFFKCNETPENGESTLPGMNAASSTIQALTDGDANTQILGKAVFNLKFEKPFVDMPGTDLVIYEAGQNSESGNVMYFNETTSGSSANFVGFSSGVTDDCGNPINAFKLDLATQFSIPVGSTITGLTINNDPDNDGGADFSDIALVNFTKIGTTQAEFTSLPSESVDSPSQSTQNSNASAPAPITGPVQPPLLSNPVNDSVITDKESNFLTYNNTDYGVSMLYPSNWTKSEENLQSHQLVGFYAPDVTVMKNTFSPAHLSVSVEPVDASMPLSEYSNQFLGAAYPNQADSKILNTTSSTISGYDAQKIVMLDFLNGQTLKELRVFSIIEGNVYRLGYYAQPGAFETYLPLVETMLSSFNVSSQSQVDTAMEEPIMPPVFPENTSDKGLYETGPFTSPDIPENTSDKGLYETGPFTSPDIPENTSDNGLYETGPIYGGPDLQGCQQIEVLNATASDFERDPKDYHPPFDAIDGDSATWWSNKAKESWIQLDLGQANQICSVSVQWNKGDIREYSFEISVSQDGMQFTNVFDGINNKGSLDPETYNVEPADGRYVKLTITGTSSDRGWASIREIGIN
jgi:hypothetical protein